MLKVVVTRRLQAFVTLARNADFAAKPANERRSGEWTHLFRLGKEPTLAAVAAAEQWLAEL